MHKNSDGATPVDLWIYLFGVWMRHTFMTHQTDMFIPYPLVITHGNPTFA